jgi:hypothetical protein
MQARPRTINFRKPEPRGCGVGSIKSYGEPGISAISVWVGLSTQRLVRCHLDQRSGGVKMRSFHWLTLHFSQRWTQLENIVFYLVFLYLASKDHLIFPSAGEIEVLYDRRHFKATWTSARSSICRQQVLVASQDSHDVVRSVRFPHAS